MNPHDNSQDIVTAAAAAATASKTTNVGAGVALLGGIFTSEMVAAVGVFVALAGFAVQWYYRHREFRLKQAEAHFRMRQSGATTGDFDA